MTEDDRKRSSTIPPASGWNSYLLRLPLGVSTTHLITFSIMTGSSQAAIRAARLARTPPRGLLRGRVRDVRLPDVLDPTFRGLAWSGRWRPPRRLWPGATGRD